MNNFSSITPTLKSGFAFLQRHLFFVTVLSFALLAGYILFLTMQLSSAPPSAAKKQEQAQAVPRPRIQPSTVDTILSLEDRNVQTQAIFQEARENPFTE